MPDPARILVVDDETRIAEVVEGCLEAQGHVVDRAASGEEALAVARAPRLILTVHGRGCAFAEDRR